MRYTWKVTDDGMNVYEDGVRVAKFETNQFVHILAELSSHVRWQLLLMEYSNPHLWQQVEKNKNNFIGGEQ